MIDKIYLSDELFNKFAELFYRFSGIKLKDYKKYLVEYRLSKFVGISKPYKTYEEFYDALIKDLSGELRKGFVQVLTTNYTYFFREGVHFDFLREYLKKNYTKMDYIRLWSAGCSTGEEAYSMAITALETIPILKSYDFKILATDISNAVLKFAIEGVYHYSKIKGSLDDKILRNYFVFDRAKKNFIVKDEVKSYVAFRYLNIMDKYPFNKKFDIVFLRNVLIYFDNTEKEYILRKIYDYIKDNGYLILGLSESIVGVRSPFKSIKNSIYVKE
ncbi:MAG: protein-glutamate O-methyltransferase CheR [Brevinematales bacterium]|nr:protein-glutamate O-methyltransferase CheR [Brevinematales bacterium]